MTRRGCPRSSWSRKSISSTWRKWTQRQRNWYSHRNFEKKLRQSLLNASEMHTSSFTKTMIVFQKSYSMPIDLDFQKRYATTVLELEQLNKDLNKVLHEVQQFCCEVSHQIHVSPVTNSCPWSEVQESILTCEISCPVPIFLACHLLIKLKKCLTCESPMCPSSSLRIRAWFRLTIPQSCGGVVKTRPSRWCSWATRWRTGSRVWRAPASHNSSPASLLCCYRSR